MNSRRRFFVLGLLAVLALATGIGLFLSGQVGKPPCEEGVTCAVARAYMSAVMEGDKRAALRLYSADALCSAPEPYPSNTVDKHIALLASSQVRNIRIDVHSAEGVAYPPGSEGAEIKFKYKTDRMWLWRSGTIWVVTGPPDADGERSICHLGGG